MADDRRRPLLVGGELLASRVDPARGGGPPYQPFTEQQARDRLGPQANRLRSEAATIPEELRADRIVFQADMLANYVANSHFPHSLLSYLGVNALGSRTIEGNLYRRRRDPEKQQSKSLVLSAEPGSFDRISEFFSTVPRTRSARAAMKETVRLDALRMPRPDEVVRVPHTPAGMDGFETAVFEAVLHPNPLTGEALTERDELYRKWLAFVASLGGTVAPRAARPVGRITFVPVELPTDRVAEAVAFNPLRALRPMPALRPAPTFTRSVAVTAPPADAAPLSDIDVVAFDGGADSSRPLFADAVTEADLVHGTTRPDHRLHGEGVTSILLYGLADGLPLEAPPAKVIHYRSLSDSMPRGRDLYWLLDEIGEVVRQRRPHVVNLSLGPEQAVEDDAEPDRWTSELDQLAYEYGTCFLVAVGNNGRADAVTGLNRVMVPSDMANGLAVGACDAPCPDAPWDRAPYSAVGPGRSTARVRPAVVAFGGTDHNPLGILDGLGDRYETTGTSFATPLVGHSLLHLMAELGTEKANANNFRVFAVHFATPADGDCPSDETGWGRALGDYSRVLGCDPNEVHVLCEGSLERDQIMAHRLPFPEAMSGFQVNMTLTIAITAPTDPAEPPEYTEACLYPTFRPHANKRVYRVDGLDKKVDVAKEANRAAEYHRQGITPSQAAVTRSLGSPTRHETEARDSGKWETVRKFGPIGMNANTLHRPTIELAYLHRQEGLLRRNSDPIDYSMLVTFRARRGDVPLYDTVVKQFPVLSDYRVAATTIVEQQT